MTDVVLKRTVAEAKATDAGRGIVRLDVDDLVKLGLSAGGIVMIEGERATYSRVLPHQPEQRGRGLISLDGGVRANARSRLGDRVAVRAEAPSVGEEVSVTIDAAADLVGEATRRLSQHLLNRPVAVGDQLRLGAVGRRPLIARVVGTVPGSPVLVGEKTRIRVTANAHQAPAGTGHRTISYDDLGGLAYEVARVREMVELPIRRPDLFARLGIEAPKGVLLSGPPGTGKTLLARAVAAECGAAFFQIDGPEIVSKHYGESEAQLRGVFEKATAKAPAIIFIDEIDAIAPKREGLGGERQLERRVVAQILTLLDGMSERGQVVVMAATNAPDSLDMALRRPGRFDREIAFRPPGRKARREILGIHARNVPLAADVDLDAMAAVTHGYVGADLAALVREAGMAALRRIAAHQGTDMESVSAEGLAITAADFEQARAEMAPSAIREVLIDKPDVGWRDVGGLDDLKAALVEAVVWPLVHADIFRRFAVTPPKGVLLVGPAGTGKTLVAKALAAEAGVNFISVRGPDLLGRYIGESEQAVRSVFAKARAAAPCIVFFDEIDALAPVRGSADTVMDRVVAQLLTEIDGMIQLKEVFLLAATNRITAIDPALLRPGRFDSVFEMPIPDEGTRAAVLGVHTRDMPMSDDVSLGSVARKTSGFVGAELEAVVQEAARAALRRRLASSTGGLDAVSQSDFEAAIVTVGRQRVARHGGLSS